MSQEALTEITGTDVSDVETLLLELVEIIDNALGATGSRDTVATSEIVNHLLDARVFARRLLDVDLKNVGLQHEEDT